MLWEVLMVVPLVGIYSEGSVWLVREVRRVLRVLGVGSKMKFWMDCNTHGVQGARLNSVQVVQRGLRRIDN